MSECFILTNNHNKQPSYVGNLTLVTQYMPVKAKWTSIIHDGKKFIAAAKNSNIAAYSYDGITWEKSIVHDYNKGYGYLAYGDGTYVNIGCTLDNSYSYDVDEATNYCAISTDGINWTHVSLPTSKKWQGVCYGGGTFVAFAAKTIIYSTDKGKSWSTCSSLGMTSAQAIGFEAIRSMAYGNGRFVWVGYSETDDEGIIDTKYVIGYSNDGVSWTGVASPERVCYSDITFDGDRFLSVVGLSQNGSDENIYVSTDGSSWSALSLDDGGRFGLKSKIRYINNRYYVPFGKYCCYSENGTTWTSVSTSLNSLSWIDMAYGNGMYILLLNNNTDKVISSTDGIIWTISDSIPYLTDVSGQNITNDILETLSYTGTLTFTGNYATSTYYTAAGCSLVVDRFTGMAFLTIQGGTTTNYENIYFTTPTLPNGVTFLTTSTSGGATNTPASRYYTAAYTGITGPINVSVSMYNIDSSTDCVWTAITMTYV